MSPGNRRSVEYYEVPAGVVITPRLAYLLHKRTNIDAARIHARGLDDEFAGVLVALRKLAMSHVVGSDQVPLNSSDHQQLAEPARELSSEQAADYLGITTRAVTKAISTKALPAKKDRGRWVIERADLEQYRADRKRQVEGR